MNEIIIMPQSLPLGIKEYNGERVVTFKDIDELHQRSEGTAGRNFRENRERFIDGEDYFIIELTDDEIRRQFGAGKNAGRELFLITKMGYLMLAKSFNDNLAWQIQRGLVKNYFETNVTQLPNIVEYEKRIQELEQQVKIITDNNAATGIDAYRTYLKSRPILTVHEAAVFIDVSDSDMRNIMKKHDFPAIVRFNWDTQKRRFIDREKFDKWIEEQKQKGKHFNV